jgi:uncharacterized membrane protein YfcA
MISGSLAGGALLDHIGLERLFQMVGAVVLLALAICAFGSNHFKVEPKPTFPEPLMAPPTSA